MKAKFYSWRLVKKEKQKFKKKLKDSSRKIKLIKNSRKIKKTFKRTWKTMIRKERKIREDLKKQ